MGEFSDKVDSSDHDASESASGPALDSEAEELADEHEAPSDNVWLAGQAKKSSSLSDHNHSNHGSSSWAMEATEAFDCLLRRSE